MAATWRRAVRSQHSGAQQVVHVERADQRASCIDHRQRGDAVLLHEVRGFGGELARADAACRGEVITSRIVDCVHVDPRSSTRRRSPSVKTPSTRPSSSTTTVMPRPLRRHLDQALRPAASSARTRGRSSPRAHHVGDVQQQLAAERAARMRAREILRR